MIIPCLGAVAYQYCTDNNAPVRLSIDLNAGEIAEVTYTYTAGGLIYGRLSDYEWHYNVTSGDVEFLSRPGGNFQNLAMNDGCLMTTVQVTTLMQAKATGTVMLEVAGNRPATCFTDSGGWCLLAKVIGKAF
ncbi:MAG TPA: hypothetical protein VES20_25655 [Bryobacteraceae bacterium]|nr:hypothetical protein [Bryobacteraceae bacterium]